MKARMNQRKLFKHIYIDRSIIPESLVGCSSLCCLWDFPGTPVFCFLFGLGIGNERTEVFVENKSKCFFNIAYCTLFFIKITKTINTNTVKLIKKTWFVWTFLVRTGSDGQQNETCQTRFQWNVYNSFEFRVLISYSSEIPMIQNLC